MAAVAALEVEESQRSEQLRGRGIAVANAPRNTLPRPTQTADWR
jgi:hypothetical protein